LKPLFSIITVVYNAGATLEETILSVVNQGLRNYEYIIIDGGSDDNTLAIINKYKSSIAKFISEPDEGIYDAMNKSLKYASGRWLFFLGADDVFCEKNTLEK
jgi:glycosyltransferase involved in cell wall biosynthesis